MEYGAKSSAEKPSSELGKQTAVSVRKDFCEATRSGSLSFPGAEGSESSGPNAPLSEEVADIKVAARAARVIPPPPLFQSRTRLGFPGFLARVFVLVLVSAAGISSFPSDASAQNRNDYLNTGAHFFSNPLSVPVPPRAETGTQSVTVKYPGITYASYGFYACPWNAVPTSALSGNSATSGCQTLAWRPNTRGSFTGSLNVTQTMLNNGGFVLVMQEWAFQRKVVVAFWVTPLADVLLSPSGGLSLVEGESETYTVKLNLQPTAAVTILVASNNAGVAVKAGSNPAGERQELTFETDDMNGKIWSTAQTVTVEAVSDDNSLDERAILSHEVSSGSAPEYSDVAGRVNVNVMDDDYPGLMITGASASESDETLDFTVRLSTASSRRVTVPWTVIAAGPDAGTATPGTAGSGDYDHSSARSGTLVFYEGGPLMRTISVPINDDSVLEGDETVKVSLGTPSPSDVRVSGSEVATGTIVDDDERTAVGATSGEFSQGDTAVTVDSTLPEDTGLEVVLPTELESDGETIEDLVVTLREADEDVEIDDDLFGYTGDDADHVLVDVDVSPVPDAAVRICLPVTEELREAAGERRLYLIRFSGGTWERLSSTVEGEMVCAETSGFSPFAVVYDLMTNMGSGSGNLGSRGSGDGGCAISGENRFASPMLPAMLLMPLLFFGRFWKRSNRFPQGE